MADRWLVLKFGGTSVAGRAQWENIASLVAARRSEGFRVLLVCSAVAGVTNQLSILARQPANGLTDLLAVHHKLSDALGVDPESWLPEAQTLLNRCLERLLSDSGPAAQAALMATGEWLSTRIGCQFLQQRFETGWIDVREALVAVQEADVSSARRWLSAACDAGHDPGLAERWVKLPPVLITQGFIASTQQGETVLLGRGGSDTSAALLAGRLDAQWLEIWTDVPGMFSADPRLIPQARLLTEVDFVEAQEIAASGARVVHPRCIRAAAETQTTIVIRDVNQPQMQGTRIGGRITAESGVKTLTCQENMIVMLLQNLDARHHVGFLAKVFDIFRAHGISVDLVATSETTTTVAFSRPVNHVGTAELQELTADLQTACQVDVFPECVCVNLVGRGVRRALGRLGPSLGIFVDRPLLMLSQSANDVCLSILVNAGDHEMLLKEAHDILIPCDDSDPGSVFGDSWERIKDSR